MVVRGWGRGEWELSVERVQFRFDKNENVLETDGGGGWTTM